MALPEHLRRALDAELGTHSFKELAGARHGLSERYRHPGAGDGMIQSDADRFAYLGTRMPATFGVVRRVMAQLPTSDIASLLDLGAGPGTASWAVAEQFPAISQVTSLERDSQLAAIGRRLAADHPLAAMRQADWLQGDLEQEQELPPRDLVLFSYSIGELRSQAMAPAIARSWQAAQRYLVIIEPGTPAGFERLRAIRSQLLAIGAHIVAPCPCAESCPMMGSDWCHFAERIERSSLHRRLKQGALGYEDEKFSYLIVAKEPHSLPNARIVRHPQHHSGHTGLTLCTSKGSLEAMTVSRRTPELYKRVRKAEWGDSW